MKYLFLGKNY